MLVNVFLNLYPNIFKALLSLAVLVLFLRIQENIEPYKNPVINKLEQREYFTSILTFFGALFFVSSDISATIQLIAFIFIIIANLWFIILWVYALTSTIKNKVTQKVAVYLRKMVMDKGLR